MAKRDDTQTQKRTTTVISDLRNPSLKRRFRACAKKMFGSESRAIRVFAEALVSGKVDYTPGELQMQGQS